MDILFDLMQGSVQQSGHIVPKHVKSCRRHHRDDHIWNTTSTRSEKHGLDDYTGLALFRRLTACPALLTVSLAAFSTSLSALVLKLTFRAAGLHIS